VFSEHIIKKLLAYEKGGINLRKIKEKTVPTIETVLNK